MHPGQFTLVVEVAPTHRRQGLGRALVAEARRIRPEPLPLVAQVQEADTSGMALLRAEGGQVVQTAPNHRFAPAEMLPWAADQAVPPGAVLAELTAVPRDELVAAVAGMYVWQHVGWASEVSMPAVTAYAGRLADATTAELSAGARVDGRLAAVALVITNPDGTVDLVTETMRRAEPDGTALVAAVLADTVHRLAAGPVTEVGLDGHVTDPHLHPVMLTFPALRTDPLLSARLA